MSSADHLQMNVAMKMLAKDADILETSEFAMGR